ncbi:MAG TPA: TraR/DksA C4-type zinc finger protein [Elusimicrobiota bacterium]|nr:TraR/DksA C4-type zinc finger protein [Elusimicrobiota bacterium]
MTDITMEKEKIDRFKSILESLVEEIEASLKIGSAMSAVVSLDDPIGRLSRVDALQSQEISLGLQAGVRMRLEMVRRALASIEIGTYGVCAGCKQPIPEARLEAMPETPLCVGCSA